MIQRKPVIDRPHTSGIGVQKIFRFANGFGASVVRFRIPSFSRSAVDVVQGAGRYGSYTDNDEEWELGVVHWPTHETRNDLYAFCYESPLTPDGVQGHLSDVDVDDLLDGIELYGVDEEVRTQLSHCGGYSDIRPEEDSRPAPPVNKIRLVRFGEKKE